MNYPTFDLQTQKRCEALCKAARWLQPLARVGSSEIKRFGY